MSAQDDSRISLNTAYFNVVHALHEALPPAIVASPLALRRRMDSAIAMVASLVPVNPAEAMLAANWVGTTMQAMDCQAMAYEPDLPWERKVKCLALANGAQRAAKGLLEQFRQMQAMRMKREGVAPSPDQAAWIEHRVGATMEAVLDEFREALAAEPDHDMRQSPEERFHETDSRPAEPPLGAGAWVAPEEPDQNPRHAITARICETDLSAMPPPQMPPPQMPPPGTPDHGVPVSGRWTHAQDARDGMSGARGATVPALGVTTGCDAMAEPGSSGAWNRPPSPLPLGTPLGTLAASPRACPSCADAPT